MLCLVNGVFLGMLGIYQVHKDGYGHDGAYYDTSTLVCTEYGSTGCLDIIPESQLL